MCASQTHQPFLHVSPLPPLPVVHRPACPVALLCIKAVFCRRVAAADAVAVGKGVVVGAAAGPGLPPSTFFCFLPRQNCVHLLRIWPPFIHGSSTVPYFILFCSNERSFVFHPFFWQILILFWFFLKFWPVFCFLCESLLFCCEPFFANREVFVHTWSVAIRRVGKIVLWLSCPNSSISLTTSSFSNEKVCCVTFRYELTIKKSMFPLANTIVYYFYEETSIFALSLSSLQQIAFLSI